MSRCLHIRVQTSNSWGGERVFGDTSEAPMRATCTLFAWPALKSYRGMTTIALDCELIGQLRRSAGEDISWCRKAKAVLVGDALTDVKERMRSMVSYTPALESAKDLASAAFQSLVREVPREEWASVAMDKESICVAIGLQVYYSALVGVISPEEFDGTFVNAWDVYSSSVRDWLN